MTGVYIIKIGDKRYIGSSIHIEDRIAQHLASLRTGRAPSKLQNAFNACSEFSYAVLEIVPDKEPLWELEVRERKWIETLRPELNHYKPGNPANSAEGNCSRALYSLSERLEYMKSVGSVRYKVKLLKSTAEMLLSFADSIEKRLVTIEEAKSKTRRKIK